jgi:hypothetical protein
MCFIGIGTHNWLWSFRVNSNVCSFQSLYSLGRCSVNTEGLIGQDAQPDAPAHRWLHPMMPNQPDAANSAMALWFAIEGQWRRVADLERSML